MSCGADLVANTLLPSLTADADITIPLISIDDTKYQLPTTSASQLYGTIRSVKIEDVTTTEVGGPGAFDTLLTSIRNHLAIEYEAGRITGAEYTKTYSELVQAALQNSISFVLQKDKQFWENQIAQITAIQGVIALDRAKIELAQTNILAYTAKTQYANEKINLAIQDQNYCKVKYEVEEILPKQVAMTEAGISKSSAETASITYNTDHVLPAQKALLTAQTSTETSKKVLTDKQQQLVVEQTATQKAQYMGTPAGYIGKQMELYDAQITAYSNDYTIKRAQVISSLRSTNATVSGEVAPETFPT